MSRPDDITGRPRAKRSRLLRLLRAERPGPGCEPGGRTGRRSRPEPPEAVNGRRGHDGADGSRRGWLRQGGAGGRGWAGGSVPMFHVAVPLAAGIALASRFAAGWVPVAAAATAVAAAWVAVRRAGRVGNAALWLFAICIGVLLAAVHRTENRLPAGRKLWVELELEAALSAPSGTVRSGRWNDYTARTRRWRPWPDTLAAADGRGDGRRFAAQESEGGGGWFTAQESKGDGGWFAAQESEGDGRRFAAADGRGGERWLAVQESKGDERWLAAQEKVLLRADTAWRLAAGERLLVGPVYVNPMADTTGYGRLMRVRGYAAAVYLPAWSRAEPLPGTVRSAARRLARFHEAASARLRSLPLSPEAAGVCAALGAGDRRWIPAGLRDAYNRAGAAHLLAVSGLHVGIVFLLVNLLLYPLPLLRRGHVVKNLLVVAAVWAYALAAGLSPSAVRAAFMFSMFQLSLAAAGGYHGLNALCGAAAVMLAFDPYALFDVSFQLSFVAVAALAVWYRPVAAWFRTRSRAVNLLCGVTVVGLVASAATAPLVACTFGRLPLLGVALNVPLAATAHVIVLVSSLWLLLPWPPLAAVAVPLLEWSVRLQNGLVESCASVGWASFEFHLSAGWWATIYLALVIGTVIWTRRR